jgi:hypothetical protein
MEACRQSAQYSQNLEINQFPWKWSPRQCNAALRRDHLINFAGYAANEIVDYRSLIKPLFLDGN